MDTRSRNIRMPDAVLPNRWQGESNCVVGPFTDPSVTDYFATFVVNARDHTATAGSVFPRGDAWYLRIDERKGGA